MTEIYPDGISDIFHGDMKAYEQLENEMIDRIIWAFFLPEWQFIDLVRFIQEKRVIH